MDGTIIPQDEIVAISDFVRPKGIKMHLDGARLWHVIAETDIPLKTLCAPFDSISVCFSKGLGMIFPPPFGPRSISALTELQVHL